MGISRRTILKLAGLTPFGRDSLHAQARTGNSRHALTLFGPIKYPAGFKNFDYVNPAAPKGGILRLPASGLIRQFQRVHHQGRSGSRHRLDH